ncbi:MULTISPECIES: hypothetical protein [Sphingobium]|uniref:hypothetical protein n=1 Tax=Sphingobium TaxID=165695 RepID=UPI001E5C67D0|nr:MULTISPECIES: hypothetical protein [Sphingobium]
MPFAPRLVKPIATRTRAGRGVSSASNSGAMPIATRFNQLSRLSCSMIFSLQIALGDGLAIGPASWRTAGERGQWESAGVVRAQ